jgi:phosphatidylglycerol:prolipoprotein diacylglycerol transferase
MRSIAVDWLSTFIGRDAAALLMPGWFACVALAWLAVSLLTLRAAAGRDDDVAALSLTLAAVYAAAIVGGIGLPAFAAAAGGLWSGQGLRLRWSGMVSYAGFACGAAALVIALRRSRTLRPARAADLLAAPLGVGLCLGRLGCFLAGCDYGQVSSVPWAVRFPAGTAAWRDHVRAGWISPQRAGSLPVHPTQLYESLLGLALCAAALLASRSEWAQRGPGRVFAVVAGGYAVGRIAIENLRGDLGRGVIGPWSSAQLFCALVLVALAASAWRCRRRIAVATSGAAIALFAIGGAAHADQPPPPAAQLATAPAPATTPAPASTAGAAPPVAIAPPQASTQASTSGDGPIYRVGAYLVGASAINRRERQVPPLGGASLTGGIRFGLFGIEIDLMSAASDVAAHQSISLALALGGPIGQRLFATVRLGLGYNVVNFEDRAFEDVGSGDLRFGGEIGFALSPRWSIVLRPIELDLIGARALGGPIWSYQLQLGVSYRFGLGPSPPSPAR